MSERVHEVLVVDDVPEILELFHGLVRRIRRANIHLTTESNSARALELVTANAYDVVVSDFRMRQADGLEVLRAARTRNPDGRRVLMTGYNEVPATLDRIRAAGVDAYVQKPLKSQELLLLLTEFIENDANAISVAREHAREVEESAAIEEAARSA